MLFHVTGTSGALLTNLLTEIDEYFIGNSHALERVVNSYSVKVESGHSLSQKYVSILKLKTSTGMPKSKLAMYDAINKFRDALNIMQNNIEPCIIIFFSKVISRATAGPRIFDVT